MAKWLNISSAFDSGDDSNIYENAVFEFEHASYLTDFDDGYDPNEDPDFEDPEGSDYYFDYYAEDETEEFEEGDAFDDTQICFKGNHGPYGPIPSLGPCNHMCCKVWHLEPIHAKSHMIMDTFLKHHGSRCTDKKCKNPNAAEILFKAILLTKPSKIFCPTHESEVEVTSETNKDNISIV